MATYVKGIITKMKPFYDHNGVTIYHADVMEVLKELPNAFVQTCVTSPPYWGLRDYGVAGQIGLEKTPEEYTAKMVEVFREVRRILRDDGTCWIILGDTYIGGGRGFDSPCQRTNKGTEGIKNFRLPPQDVLKVKDLVGIPWRVAFALQADGWYLRQDIIWHKPSVMPESVTDRCTKGHEYIFLLAKSRDYFFDNEAIKEPSVFPDDDRKGRAYDHHKSAPTFDRNGIRGKSNHMDVKPNYLDSGRRGYPMRNRRSVWSITTGNFRDAHFATFPPKLPETCIKAGSSERGACAGCGSPHVRILEKVGEKDNHGGNRKLSELMITRRGDASLASSFLTDGKTAIRKTTGWKQSCKCDGGRVLPCVVMDIFHGAGTTAMVAKELGRRYIGIELNQKYIELSLKRFRQDILPL